MDTRRAPPARFPLPLAGTTVAVAYPPNPAAVGRADTIRERTTLYILMVAISLIAAVAAVLVGRRLAERWGGWHATRAATAARGAA